MNSVEEMEVLDITIDEKNPMEEVESQEVENNE